MGTDERAGKLCTLESVVGSAAACPGDGCPFWEPGHQPEAGACMFDEVTVALRQPDVAGELLALRNRLLELWPSVRPEAG